MTKRLKRRRTSSKLPKAKLVIFCEGEKTEPCYFQALSREPQFRQLGLKIESGVGSHPTTLVNKALKHQRDNPQDEIWCVWDLDRTASDPREKAKTDACAVRANKRGVQVAATMPAFELWALLHFEYYDAAISSPELEARLESRHRAWRARKELDSDKLAPRRELAIEHARKLRERSTALASSHGVPRTDVDQLIAAIKRFRQ